VRLCGCIAVKPRVSVCPSCFSTSCVEGRWVGWLRRHALIAVAAVFFVRVNRFWCASGRARWGLVLVPGVRAWGSRAGLLSRRVHASLTGWLRVLFGFVASLMRAASVQRRV